MMLICNGRFLMYKNDSTFTASQIYFKNYVHADF